MSETVPDHWYQPVAEFLGRAYLRNAFTKGTVQEVDYLMERLCIDPDAGRTPRLLDAGCGPGRHALEFARRGVEVTGVDISPRFVDIAREDAVAEGLEVEFRLGDLRLLDERDSYDAVVCLCEGGFGLVGGGVDGDLEILTRLTRALRAGGRLALSAFSAFYAVSQLEPDGGHSFDPSSGLFREVAELRNENGETKSIPADTRCYTPQELILMARMAGLGVDRVSSVDPGKYRDDPPDLESAEYLLLACRSAHAENPEGP